ncbi:MAG: hypothetical protein E6F95_03345 [Actinobacteria bacterium]|nr:MAG: hypothetical protein E6F95_03345 [Actinomycetota bacterium]
MSAIHTLSTALAGTGEPAALSTETILEALIDNDEGPWARWWSVDSDHARRSAASGLARHLRPFARSTRMHRQQVDDVGPVFAMSVAVAEQLRGGRVTVGLVVDQDAAERVAGLGVKRSE